MDEAIPNVFAASLREPKIGRLSTTSPNEMTSMDSNFPGKNIQIHGRQEGFPKKEASCNVIRVLSDEPNVEGIFFWRKSEAAEMLSLSAVYRHVKYLLCYEGLLT